MDEITTLKQDIREIKDALIGSPMQPNSIMNRIHDIEQKLESLESTEIKNGIYFKILIFISTIVTGKVIYSIFELLNTK